MKVDVRKLYNEEDSGLLGEWSDYTPMINAFGNVAIRVDSGNYSGDTYVLYNEGHKFGYLSFGWGSCTGCDALQACKNLDEVQTLCDELYNSIKWFKPQSEALDWFIKHDWEGDYSWSDDNTKVFVDMAIHYLRKIK